MVSKSGLEPSLAWIADAYRKHNPHDIISDIPPTTTYSWKLYDPEIVLRVLCSDQRSYTSHKDMLFAGFCTWVICPQPQRINLVRNAMALAALQYLIDSEEKGRKSIPEFEALGDALGRLISVHRDFYADFYYPVGGIRTLSKTRTATQFRRQLSKSSAAVPSIVHLMQIFHFHSIKFGLDSRYYKASLNKGAKLAADIFRDRRGNGVGLDKVEERWISGRSSAALVYAASTIEVGGATLLDVISRGQSSWAKHGHLIALWIGRARYAGQEILSKLQYPQFAKINLDPLPNVMSEVIAAPSFTNEEQQLIEHKFDQQLILQRRRK